jgi:hypothetical protein
MEQSPPWETISHLDRQEIRRYLWNPKVNYRVRKITLLIPVMSQMNPVHTFPLIFSKLHNVIRLEIFLSTTASRPALGPTQPPIQWIPGGVSFPGSIAAGEWSWPLIPI